MLFTITIVKTCLAARLEMKSRTILGASTRSDTTPGVGYLRAMPAEHDVVVIIIIIAHADSENVYTESQFNTRVWMPVRANITLHMSSRTVEHVTATFGSQRSFLSTLC